jgi:hypothetical protein
MLIKKQLYITFFILVGCILLRYVYVYLSNIAAIATENLLVLLFSLCSQHVSAPTGHLQVKYNYITYIS